MDISPGERRIRTSFITLKLKVLFIIVTILIPSVFSTPKAAPVSSKNLSPCTIDADCDSKTFLRCFQNKCQCSAINYFDEEINRCLIRVGGTCQVKSKIQYCVAFAECVATPSSSSRGSSGQDMGSCRCRPKHKETMQSLCSNAQLIAPQNAHILIPLSILVRAIVDIF